MPYSKLTDINPSVRKVLPTHAQRIYMAAYNSAWEQYNHDEERAHATAWAAVGAKYEKDEKTGQWRRMKESCPPATKTRRSIKDVLESDLPVAAKGKHLAALRDQLRRMQAKRDKTMESARPRHTEALREAGIVGFGEVPEDGVYRNCALIRVGANATGRRYYTESFLRRELPRMEGALCYVDHPTVTESAERPERSLEKVAARVTNPYVTSAGAFGDVVLMEPGVEPADHIRNLFRDPVIREVAGLSIYWPFGVSSHFAPMGDALLEVPDALEGPENAKLYFDFVTTPTAGGQVAT